MLDVITDVPTDVTSAAATIDANPYAFLSHLGHLSQVELHEDEHLTWISANLPISLFNSVFHVHLDTANGNMEAHIASTVARFTTRGRSCMWWLGPSTQPSNLGEHLAVQGGAHVDTLSLMACDLSVLSPFTLATARLTVEAVRDQASLEAWTKVYSEGRGHTEIERRAWLEALAGLELTPAAPLQHYVGYMDGQPAVCASVFLAAGVAGLYNVTTLREMRRRGFGGTVTVAAFREACKRGYRIGVLGSEPMAHSLYQRLGFVDCGQMHVYAWPSIRA